MIEITENSYILSVVTEYPQTIPIFLKYGVQCIGCKNADKETLIEAARCNGVKNVETLVSELILVAQSKDRLDGFVIKRIFDCRKEQSFDEPEEPI